jgi:hypothetical protein
VGGDGDGGARVGYGVRGLDEEGWVCGEVEAGF